MFRRLAVVFIIGLATSSTAAIDAGLSEGSWQELRFDGKAANRYGLNDEGGVSIEGDSSVSVIWRPLEIVDPSNLQLSWRWKVDQAPPTTNLSSKGGDDRPLSLYVSFEFDPERSTFWERSKRALVQPFVDEELPGRVLLYVWGDKVPSETWIDSPYFSGVGKMKILQASDSELSRWYDQSVDLAADFREAFAEEPTLPYQLAISSDSDDTGSKVRAAVAEIRLAGQPIL